MTQILLDPQTAQTAQAREQQRVMDCCQELHDFILDMVRSSRYNPMHVQTALQIIPTLAYQLQQAASLGSVAQSPSKENTA